MVLSVKRYFPTRRVDAQIRPQNIFFRIEIHSEKSFVDSFLASSLVENLFRTLRPVSDTTLHCHLINPLTISHYLCHVFIAFVKMNSHISDRFCNPSSEKMYGDKNVCSAGMDFANVICYITLDAIK